MDPLQFWLGFSLVVTLIAFFITLVSFYNTIRGIAPPQPKKIPRLCSWHVIRNLSPGEMALLDQHNCELCKDDPNNAA